MRVIFEKIEGHGNCNGLSTQRRLRGQDHIRVLRKYDKGECTWRINTQII